MDHMPRFLERPLPIGRGLTTDDLHAMPEDPFWKYELIEGALIVSSDGHGMTADDLHSIPGQEFWKFELIEGTLIVSPNAPSLRHQTCAFSLAILLRQACPPELQTVVAPFEYLPIPEMSMQPDVLVARRPIAAKRLTEAPVLAVEVLSRDSRTRDTSYKRAIYQQLGVEHYWMVDPDGPSIRALALIGGSYQDVAQAGPGEVFAVHRPVELQFDPASLLDD